MPPGPLRFAPADAQDQGRRDTGQEHPHQQRETIEVQRGPHAKEIDGQPLESYSPHRLCLEGPEDRQRSQRRCQSQQPAGPRG